MLRELLSVTNNSIYVEDDEQLFAFSTRLVICRFSSTTLARIAMYAVTIVTGQKATTMRIIPKIYTIWRINSKTKKNWPRDVQIDTAVLYASVADASWVEIHKQAQHWSTCQPSILS